MTVFFTADTHFGHGGARALYRRPFASTAEMDRALIENWNATVAEADEVWHLGDVALGPKPEAVAAVLARLNGRKHLIRGNNDPDAICALLAWASVHELVTLELDGINVTLCHYALRTWPRQGRGGVNLHGHSHGRLKPLPKQYDVGIDAQDFRPIKLEQLTGALPRTPPAAGPLDRQN